MAEDQDLGERFEREFKENQMEFIETLGLVVDETHPGWIEEVNHRESSDILSIGFGGTASEFLPLSVKFPKARLFGIDLAPDALKRDSIELVSNKPIPNLYIVNGDAGKPESYLDEQGQQFNADLIVVRSPDTHSGGWQKTMKQAWDHLKPGGIIYVTTNGESEVEKARAIMEDANIPISPTMKNPISHKGISYFPETEILIARKSV